MEKRRVIVTGAAGFIGSHTVDRLLAEGCEVLGLDNLSTGREENLAGAGKDPSFRLEVCDVAEEGTVEAQAAAFRPQAIIHLAALVSVPKSMEEPELNYRCNLLATHRVAEAARLSGCQRLVFASSAAVYGDQESLPIDEQAPLEPISPYGAAKLASEHMLLGHARSFGMQAWAWRYFNIFGPRQDPASPYSGVLAIFSDRLAAGKPLTIFGDGEQTRDFVYVADVAAGNCKAALEPDVPIAAANLCRGEGISLNRLVEGLRVHFPDSEPASHGPEREGDIKHSRGNPQKARKLLDYTAQTPLEEGLRGLLGK